MCFRRILKQRLRRESEMLEGEKDKLLRMEAEVAKRVIGQEEAVKAVSTAVRRARAGLQDPKTELTLPTPPERLRELRDGQSHKNIAARQLTDGGSGLLRAGRAVDLRLEFEFALVVVLVHEPVAVCASDDDGGGHAADENREHDDDAERPGVEFGFHSSVARPDEGRLDGLEFLAVGIHAQHQPGPRAPRRSRPMNRFSRMVVALILGLSAGILPAQ